MDRLGKVSLLVAGAVAGAVLVGVLNRQVPAHESDRTLPLVLRGVQKIGMLHTAKHTYENVFEYSTSRQPLPWVAMVPGGTELVRTGTRNSVLVSAKGEIEAGIDLSKATAVRSGKSLTVRLPRPQLFEPKVDAKVHWQKSAVFWHDENIALKAVRDAEGRIKEASLRQHILETAADEASTVVKSLARDLGVDVDVTFG